VSITVAVKPPNSHAPPGILSPGFCSTYSGLSFFSHPQHAKVVDVVEEIDVVVEDTVVELVSLQPLGLCCFSTALHLHNASKPATQVGKSTLDEPLASSVGSPSAPRGHVGLPQRIQHSTSFGLPIFLFVVPVTLVVVVVVVLVVVVPVIDVVVVVEVVVEVVVDVVVEVVVDVVVEVVVDVVVLVVVVDGAGVGVGTPHPEQP
jgi:hypothetical protein